MKIYIKAGYRDNSPLVSTHYLALELEPNQTISELRKEITDVLRTQLGERCTIGTPDELVVLQCGKRLKTEQLSTLIWGKTKNEPLLVVLPKVAPSKRFIKKELSTFFEDSTYADLNQVGIKKSLGYLSQDTLTLGGYKIEELQAGFSKQGINTYYNGQFLYAYHKESFEQFLKENQDDLAGWPLDAEQFVRRLPNETVSRLELPKLFDVISNLFTNPELLASDTLPGSLCTSLQSSLPKQ